MNHIIQKFKKKEKEFSFFLNHQKGFWINL